MAYVLPVCSAHLLRERDLKAVGLAMRLFSRFRDFRRRSDSSPASILSLLLERSRYSRHRASDSPAVLRE